MTVLLACILTVLLLGLRSGSKRPDARWAVPLFIACCFVAIAYLSQRVV
jgi:hypothetical protein